MSTEDVGSSRRARLGRLALLGAAATLVVAPIMVGLVVAWQVHPLVVVPAYLVGIPVWLTLLSGAWSLASRMRPTRDQPLEPPTSTLPTVRTELRLPGVRTPIP